MAKAQTPATKSSTEPTETERFQEIVLVALASGKRPGEIAMKLAKGDKRKASAYRKRIRRLMYNPSYREKMIEAAKVEATVGFVNAMPAVSRRAARGRTDAAKLLGEVSGAHNQKVNHEHSGAVEINLNMPRPERIPNPAIDVPDAEVVED